MLISCFVANNITCSYVINNSCVVLVIPSKSPAQQNRAWDPWFGHRRVNHGVAHALSMMGTLGTLSAWERLQSREVTELRPGSQPAQRKSAHVLSHYLQHVHFILNSLWSNYLILRSWCLRQDCEQVPSLVKDNSISVVGANAYPVLYVEELHNSVMVVQ